MLRLILLVFLVTAIDASQWKEKPSKFRPDYEYVAEINGWLKLHGVPTHWTDARARCQLEGAELASPSDELMLKAMINISKTSSGARCGIYTGIHSWFSEGDFTSIEGTPLWEMPVEFTSFQTCPMKVNHPCTVLLPSGSIDTVDGNQPYLFICYRKEEKVYNKCDCGTIDHEYKFYETSGKCYKFHLQPQTWPDAYKICLAEGGHLAVINSAQEAMVISSIFEQYSTNSILSRYKNSVLLGFKKLHGTWSTIHGQSLEKAGYSRWSPGQPDSSPHPFPGGKKEYCGSMFRTGLLDDIWCDVEFAFICERNLPDANNDEEVPV